MYDLLALLLAFAPAPIAQGGDGGVFCIWTKPDSVITEPWT